MSRVEGPGVGMEGVVSALHYQSVISPRPNTLLERPPLPSRLTMKLPTSLMCHDLLQWSQNN
jgi:hypothetical protein